MAEKNTLLKQYAKIKEENKDNVQLFRLGDFYELFYDGELSEAGSFLHEVKR